jgi:uncharacterized protein
MGDSSAGKGITRRGFLQLGMVGAATAAVGLSPASTIAQEIAGKGGLGVAPVYRTLGRTVLKVTVISFGAMLTPEHEVIRAGFDLGINYVDTARRYMNGRNEEIVAKALKGYRDKVYVATKTPGTSTSKKDIIKDVETSLSKLETDYVDVIQLHNVTSRERAYNPESREALLELRKQGKVRFLGVSTHTNQAEVLNALAEDPDKFFDTALVSYNFKSGKDLQDAVARVAKAGMGVIGMKALAGGYKTEGPQVVSPHQAAIKWVLQDTNVSCVIAGMRDMEMLKEDVAVMGMKLTQNDSRVLERYGRAIEPYYCRFCAGCEAGCPQGVAISVVNRSLMYAESYGSIELARSAYSEIGSGHRATACVDCGTCTAHCLHGIRDIGARMRRAVEVLA